MEKFKILIDTKGADGGDGVMIRGALRALDAFEELSVILVGNEDKINEECAKENAPMDRIEIVNTEVEITNDDNPAEALFTKSDSSMLRGLYILGTRDDVVGMISSGNTGVLLTGAMRYVSAKERVRPALAAILPASNGSFVCVVDTGATIDSTPQMLCHFAHLGSDFMRSAYGIEQPKIGLLSNGAEESKGNKLVKETHPLLKSDPSLNFIGNVEGNTALSGVCDVLVCDGFAGNQVLKVTEGTAMRIITDVMKYAHREGSEEVMKLGAHLMKIYDISSLGGGVILGIAKHVIKTRGNANENSVVNVSGMLLNLARGKSVFDKSKNKI
jgi:glycerol-3-phosphate acyltransferase PlsX